MNKRILILVNHEIVIYNFRKELVKKLIENGYEVYIASPTGEKIEKLKEMGCKFKEIIFDRHGKNPVKDFLLVKKYSALVKELDPFVVLTYTIKPNIFGSIAAFINQVPCIANITGLGTAVENKSFLQKITIFLYKIAFKNIDTVFFQNKENMDFFFKNKIPVGNFSLLPGSGVNLLEFEYIKYPKATAIEFVYISRVMKEKGIDQYLAAAELIKKKYPHTIFHVCGFCEGDYNEILNKYMNKGIIEYHGMVEDIREILKYTHCTIHPSYYPEGISNVLLESSACGRPIITTDRSGCREVVNENGYLIKEKDIDSLVRAIEDFLKLDMNERERMGKKGRKFVSDNFDRKIVIDEYIKKIDSIELRGR